MLSFAIRHLTFPSPHTARGPAGEPIGMARSSAMRASRSSSAFTTRIRIWPRVSAHPRTRLQNRSCSTVWQKVPGCSSLPLVPDSGPLRLLAAQVAEHHGILAGGGGDASLGSAAKMRL